MSEPRAPQEDPPELAPELRSLLAVERLGERPSAAARARVFAQLGAVITPAIPLPTRAPLRTLLGSKGVAVAVAFGLGTATGVGVHARFVRAPRIELPSAVVPPVALPALPTPPPEITPPPTPAARSHTHAVPAPRVSSPVPAPAPPTGDATLAVERRLIEQARSALVRGAADAALQALELHARAYPTGRLAEERDALRVQAFVAAGRLDDARVAAGAFHRRYPHSLLGPAVDEALRL